MEAQKPTPAPEANVSAATGSDQGVGAATGAGELDLSAIRGGSFGGFLGRGKRIVLVSCLVGAASAAGWAGYRFCTPEVQETSPAHREGAGLAATRPSDEVHPAAQASEPQPPPASWTDAQRAYAAKQYSQALEQYRQLAAMTASSPGRTAIHELFVLRAADCLQKTGDAQEYRQQLNQVGEACSPLVYSLANYRLAALDCQQELWLQGRSRAYRALAAGALTGPAEPFQAECLFLIARCLTQQILKLTGVSADVAWSEQDVPDPIGQWDERELIQAITKGGEAMSSASLGPRFEKQIAGPAGVNWQAFCWRSPLEQVASRFAHESGVNIEWSSVAPSVRQRPVTLLGEMMNQRRLLETAAGAAGLLARSDGAVVRVYDLAACESVAQQQQVLAGEAMAIWTRLAQASGEGPPAAEGQFALGLLRECTGDPAGAVPDLRQTALRFPRARVAPYALMRSARINMTLRDYPAAQDDLTNLMNTYPEHPGMEDIFLLLAKACAESSRPAEAAALFKKVYLLDRSAQSKAQAALAAGMNCHRMGAHADAVQWLERYLAVVRPTGHAEIPAAYLAVARSRLAMGEAVPAVRALRQCRASRPAIDVERRDGGAGEPGGRHGRLQPRGGMLAHARRPRRNRHSPGPDPPQDGPGRQGRLLPSQTPGRTRGRPESRPALAGTGPVPPRRRRRSRSLPPGQRTTGSGQEREGLAELSVKLQKGRQAIVLMEDVLKTTPDPAVRRRCTQTLAAAHVAEKDFEKAALIMAANANGGTTGGPK
ncbi:MAG: hypothetical protein NT031_12270 [Planctomycetota bacterium]|nr:hypothetical protein [Planctomycetota bacterium]